MGYGQTDPILLAAQARAVLQNLHLQNDIVVRFKTDESGFEEDALDDMDRSAEGGHFRADKNLLTLNLDKLIRKGKPRPVKLDSIEDFRQHPVLAGAAAHEAGHARWTTWNELPASIPNPDFDPEATVDEEGTNVSGPESFPVSGNGKLIELAGFMEEPRIERLGTKTFTKTWRRAMQLSAGHLILEQVDEMDADGVNPLDSAVRLAALVGGRQMAGTLGTSYESRKSVQKILDSARQIIETAVADFPEEDQTEEPFDKIMSLINGEVFSNDHEDAVSHLEAARQILKIVHPEEKDNPDEQSDEDGEGSGSSAGAGEGDEDGEGAGGGAMAAALSAMADEMRGNLDAMNDEIQEAVKSEEEAPASKENNKTSGYGSTLYRNPEAPQVARHEQPTAEDRELYRRALAWMERQIEPTVTEAEFGQWLPVGGARLDVRSWIRDNLAGHRGTQRTDWNQVSETVKPAPPVKVAIMLDGSGSMGRYARPSAAIAWAAANAAAALPESRTVSVVYGNAAQVTQAPGHLPARDIAVSRTDGGTEAFIEAAQMVEEALWLDQAVEEGENSNTLIIIVSDLQYGGEDTRTGEGQFAGFTRITKDWAERGYQTVVVGSDPNQVKRMFEYNDRYHSDRKMKGTPEELMKNFEIKKPEELFR